MKISLPQSPPERPLRADARRNRERILSAAVEAFGEYGPETQMDDVARRAGVGVGTLYRHYPTKTALMEELVRQKVAMFTANAEAALAGGGGAFRELAALLRANAEAVESDAATRYAMGAGAEIWAAADRERARLEDVVGGLIARGRREGELREDLTVADIPMIMCAVANSIERGFDWRRHLELMLDALRGPAHL